MGKVMWVMVIWFSAVVLSMWYFGLTGCAVQPEAPASPVYPMPLDNNRYSHLPECLHEDGNPDGNPCLWIDPDTTVAYPRSSSEYRN